MHRDWPTVVPALLSAALLFSCGDSGDDGGGGNQTGGGGKSGGGSGGSGAGAAAMGGVGGAAATGGASGGTGAIGGGGATGGAAGAGGSAGTAGFATYLGGSVFEHIRDVVADAAGNVYVVGGTTSPNFPTTTGVFQPQKHPGPPSDPAIDAFDVFVAKLDASGKLVWSSYLGGPNYDRAYAVGVDSAGNVFVAGRSGAGFPVTTGAFQTQFNGGQAAPFYGPQDGFLCKIAPDGSKLVFCSYFGTSDPWIIRDLAVDHAGDVYIASARGSGSYPSAVASKFVNAPLGGGDDAVIAKVKGDGSQIVWARYVGGSGQDEHQNSVRVDAAGNPTLLFTTQSTDIQTSANAYDKSYGGNGDLFVARLDPANGGFVWGTYLGGSGNESTETHELAVDATGTVFVAAPTTSANFPTTPGVVQPNYGGGTNDMFAAKISSDGSQLVASTFFGGNQNDRPEGCGTGPKGFYFTGSTTSPNFPVSPGAPQPTLKGTRDVVAVVLSSDLTQVVYSSYVGGSGDDYGRGARVSPGGVFFFGGETPSTDFPVANAYQPTFGGVPNDAFIAAISP